MATLLETAERGGDRRLTFAAPEELLADAAPGDSMSVSGVGLTMLDLEVDRFSADVSTETLTMTTLGELQPGQGVNLEPALRAADRLGGHLVSGHVDGRARLLSRGPDGRAERFEFEVPAELARYLARKGSVCVDGVSLTINGAAGTRFDVCIIPHTWEVTTLGRLRRGDEVNLEVDLVARYLERLLEPEPDVGQEGGSS